MKSIFSISFLIIFIFHNTLERKNNRTTAAISSRITPPENIFTEATRIHPEKSLILLFKSISTFRKWTKINVQFSKIRKYFPKKGVFVTEMSF